MVKPLKLAFWESICTTKGSSWATPKMKNKSFFAEITKADAISFQKLFIFLSKYHMFWLSYESFSVFCDVFLSKNLNGSFPNISCQKIAGNNLLSSGKVNLWRWSLKIGLLILEKSKQGVWGHTFLNVKYPLEFLGFLFYPWKFKTKKGSTPRNSSGIAHYH